MTEQAISIIVALIGLACFIAALALSLKGRSASGVDELMAKLDHQDGVLQELKGRYELGDRGQDLIREELVRASRTLTALQVDLAARKRYEEENREIVKRLESVIAGSHAKGRAGENILRETLKVFPPEMVEADFRIGGRVVEFALKLFDGKVLPIDSKWPSTSLLLALDQEKEEAKRLSIVSDIEREVARRVREVSGYIDPAKTVPWALAAVPDSVFSVCRRAFLDAQKLRVMLTSYSMAVPFILTFYNLYLQYSRSVDIANLQVHLAEVEHALSEVESLIENRLSRGSTMIANACADLRQLMGKTRGSLAYLRSLEEAEFEGVRGDVPVEANGDRGEKRYGGGSYGGRSEEAPLGAEASGDASRAESSY